MKDRRLLAGNWKMNLSLIEAKQLTKGIVDYVKSINFNYRVIVAPAFPFLTEVGEIIKEVPNVYLSAQNVSEYESGAYTGEVSASMLASVGASYCIVGHSERRKYFNETEEVLLKKINRLYENAIIPIYCVGETLEERKQGKSEEIVKSQLEPILAELTKEQINNFVIAYEPVWAIGTGIPATPEEANSMHKFIRELVKSYFDEEIAENITVLYGGSVKPENAEALFSQPNIDGGLVGGASLKYSSFNKLIEILFR